MMKSMVQEAEVCARAAADRSGLRIVPLVDFSGLSAAVALLNEVWRVAPSDAVANTALLRAYEFSGNYVVGAMRDDQLVGVAIGFFGNGHLHSDLVGVPPGRQRTGIGFALKQHQRAWALAQGVTEIRWTFDPLLRRNAHFNLRKLGATVAQYLPDFYGPLTDGINALDASDRLYVSWQLATTRATGAARRELPAFDVTVLRGAQVLLDHDGTLSARDAAAGSSVRLVAVPDDIEAVRVKDRASADHWRRAVRTALSDSMAEGYRISDFAPEGSYVLTRAGAG